MDLATELAQKSADEMLAAVGLRRAPAALRTAARGAFAWASGPLGRTLARFDSRIDALGIDRAAALVLDDLGARWTQGGRVPKTGALLVVANHPGAYDALVLLAAIERKDVAIVAADRVFLRALPRMGRHLLFVPEDGTPAQRVAGVRRALAHLGRGGALLHFGAGRIENDPAFSLSGLSSDLLPWKGGIATLVRGAARADGQVATAIVEGVHSPRAKRLLITRVAEHYGLTTLAPLLQVSMSSFHDVDARVHFDEPVAARELLMRAANADEISENVRRLALALLRRSRS